MSSPPKWLGSALAVARHADQVAAWPAWKQWLHKIFISKRCPACIEYAKWGKPR